MTNTVDVEDHNLAERTKVRVVAHRVAWLWRVVLTQHSLFDTFTEMAATP